jgi:hypothetical protein
MSDRISNNVFASNDFSFGLACERAGIPTTGRQAGKYRRGMGQAWASRPTAVDLGKLTVPKLREAAQRSGIAVPSRARKADVIAALLGE